MIKGRYRSPWTQAFYLPQMRNTDYHFRSRNGYKLQGAWDTMYLVDSPDVDYDEWALRCSSEGAAGDWITHTNIKVPGDEQCDRTMEMVLAEARAMRTAESSEWSAWPMQRGACDGFVPCSFQPACYSDQPVKIDSIPLYVRHAEDTVPAQSVETEVTAQ